MWGWWAAVLNCRTFWPLACRCQADRNYLLSIQSAGDTPVKEECKPILSLEEGSYLERLVGAHNFASKSIVNWPGNTDRKVAIKNVGLVWYCSVSYHINDKQSCSSLLCLIDTWIGARAWKHVLSTSRTFLISMKSSYLSWRDKKRLLGVADSMRAALQREGIYFRVGGMRMSFAKGRLFWTLYLLGTLDFTKGPLKEVSYTSHLWGGDLKDMVFLHPQLMALSTPVWLKKKEELWNSIWPRGYFQQVPFKHVEDFWSFWVGDLEPFSSSWREVTSLTVGILSSLVIRPKNTSWLLV